MLTSSFDRATFYSALRDAEVRLAEDIRACRARHRAGPCSSSNRGNWYPAALHGFGMRSRYVKDALADSLGMARCTLLGKLGSIGIDRVWPTFREVGHDIALYLGGGAIAGRATGGGLGSLVFRGDAVYGAESGSVMGKKMAAMLLGFLGVKPAVQHMLENIPRAVNEYRLGFKEAWGYPIYDSTPGRITAPK